MNMCRRARLGLQKCIVVNGLVAAGWVGVSCPPLYGQAEGSIATETGVVLTQNFDSAPIGPVGTESLVRLFPSAESIYVPPETRIAEYAPGNHALMAYYRVGGVGPSRSGVTFVVRLPVASAYELSYRILLSESFDFRLGGKLPGLCSGGGRYSGGRIPIDGDGWSARLSWGRSGSLGAYLYHWRIPGPFGLGVSSRAVLSRARWHEVRQQLRVNSGDLADGVLRVWVDGDLVIDRADIPWRREGKGGIDSICFSSFHGGSRAEFAPRSTGFALIDDVLVRQF